MIERGDINPRPDCSQVDPEAVREHIWAIVRILNSDEREYVIADHLRQYVKQYLNPHPETWCVVNDELAARKILSKKQLKDWLSLSLEVDLSEGHWDDL